MLPTTIRDDHDDEVDHVDPLAEFIDDEDCDPHWQDESDHYEDDPYGWDADVVDYGLFEG